MFLSEAAYLIYEAVTGNLTAKELLYRLARSFFQNAGAYLGSNLFKLLGGAFAFYFFGSYGAWFFEFFGSYIGAILGSKLVWKSLKWILSKFIKNFESYSASNKCLPKAVMFNEAIKVLKLTENCTLA
jgi:hypothetical protein